MSEFDRFSGSYTEINDRMLGGTGESTESLAEAKVDYLERLVGPGFDGNVLDYGCGVGVLSRAVARRFRDSSVDGYDPSAASLGQASVEMVDGIRYLERPEQLSSSYDLILLVNVLHHVPPAQRQDLVDDLARRLRPHGRLVLIEHNTFNPLVMRLVARHPFDRDAKFLPPSESEMLLERAKLATRTDFIVFFPGPLRPLRFLEPALSRFALGAQYACVGIER